MSEVSFSEEKYAAPARRVVSSTGNTSFLTRLVISSGIAKDEREAQFALLVIAVCTAILAGFFFVHAMLPVKHDIPDAQLASDLARMKSLKLTPKY